MDKILLTGASGFVGSYFMQHYGQKYTIIPFSFRKDDFSALSLDGIKAVVHLSALVHQMGGASYEAYYEVNVTQTLQLAQKAKDAGVGHFVFMSSIKVCGEESSKPYSETTQCKPQDDYGKTKYEAEQRLLELVDDSFCVSIIRTPIVYGYGVKANIQSLVQLVAKVPFLPFGDINNKRSMIYIGNLTYIIDHLIQTRQGGIYFVADDTTLSTKEFILAIAKAQKKHITLIHIPLFALLLKKLKPSFYKRLYESLQIDTRNSKHHLFGSDVVKLPYSVEDGIEAMVKGL